VGLGRVGKFLDGMGWGFVGLWYTYSIIPRYEDGDEMNKDLILMDTSLCYL